MDIFRGNPRDCCPVQNVVDAERGYDASGRHLWRVVGYIGGVMLVAMQGCRVDVGVEG